MPEFRTLASLFVRVENPSSEMPAQQQVADDVDRACEKASAVEIALSDARLLRSHLREAIDEALDALLADIASEVVGRELQLLPAHIEQIVAAAIERYRYETPVRVRVNPEDAADVTDLALELICDEKLKRGDAMLELREGAIDLTLGVRLERLLQRAR